LLIADCRPMVARALADAFEETDGVVIRAVCYEAGSLSTQLAPAGSTDALVVDTEMFEGNASRAIEVVRGLDPTVAVLLLTTRVDDALLRAIAHELVSCISAYSEALAIVSALWALLAGQSILPHEVQRALTEMLRRPPAPPDTLLTLREQQVLELAATGLTISQIGATLHISHSTAKAHLLRVYEKLHAPNRSAAVANAVARGILRLSTEAA
jgi:DNA-binding NarL/FixJ family response regulator